MKTSLKYLILIISIVFTNIGFSQATYKIHQNDTISMKLSGTSTMHNWEMNAITATGEAQFTFKSIGEKDLASLKSLTFNLKVEDLKSDSKGLDKNAYKSLKTNEFKNIHYIVSTSTLSPEKEGYLLKAKGKLTVAGVTKNIAMDMHIVVYKNNTIRCKGTYTLNMTDYNVEPPSFMMGIMKTGNDTTLDFAVTYIK